MQNKVKALSSQINMLRDVSMELLSYASVTDKMGNDYDVCLAAYVVLGINEDGMKEVLSIEVGENESSKYWLGDLNSFKNRGVQDILILCSDGLTGLKEAIQAAFPNTEHQRCIVHMVRNTLKYVANKDMKAFARNLKTIYTSADECLPACTDSTVPKTSA